MKKTTNAGVINCFFSGEKAINRAGILKSFEKLLLSEGRIIARRVGENNYLIVSRYWGITRSGKLHATTLHSHLEKNNQLNVVKFTSALDLAKDAESLIDMEQAKRLAKIERLRLTSFSIRDVKFEIVRLQKKIECLRKLGNFEAVPAMGVPDNEA